jgi:hypothetical protein
MPVTETKKSVDWDGMEPLWRAGILSVSKLATDFGVSRAAIHKHWDKLGVSRDLSGKIRAEADAIVAREEVKAKRLQEQVTKRDPVTDAETVSTNAAVQAAAILAERKDVGRFRELANSLFKELEDAAKPQEGQKPATLASRIDNAKKLAETFKILFGLERQVLNIVDDTPVDPSARIAEAVENGIDGLRAAFDRKLGRAT